MHLRLGDAQLTMHRSGLQAMPAGSGAGDAGTGELHNRPMVE
jgi:hypothetical protein